MECISDKSLNETYNIVLKLINCLEANYIPVRQKKGPIYLSKHGLYKDISNSRNKYWTNWRLMNLVGSNKSVLEISKELKKF